LPSDGWSWRDEHPQDVSGCFLSAARLGCGMASLWIIMFTTMVIIALLSLMLFR
jgi:hypothetical protein